MYTFAEKYAIIPNRFAIRLAHWDKRLFIIHIENIFTEIIGKKIVFKIVDNEMLNGEIK